MLSRFAKLLLVATSLAPILVTWAFADWREHGASIAQLSAVVVALLLVVLCALLIRGARRLLGEIQFAASAIKTADSEVVGFIVAYLLPLVSAGSGRFDPILLVFIMLLLGLIVWSSNAYSVNPLLSLFGYHFYEVTNTDGVTFLFLARRELQSVNDVTSVKQLSRYVLLDGV